MSAEIIEEGTFDPADFADELAAAPTNLAIGTTLWFENERLNVWEVKLQPGERGPFRAHTRNYFWTVVEGGRGPEGIWRLRDRCELATGSRRLDLP